MDDGGIFLAEMWQGISPMVEGVVIVLIVMFFWTLVEMAGKSAWYGAAIWQSRRFLEASAGALARGDSEILIALAEKRKYSHVATVFGGGLREFRRACEFVSVERSMEMAEREAHVAGNRLHEKLRKGLSGLGSIATTAPLVGLLGTVVGILNSFRGIGMQRATAMAMVGRNIAEALVSTALGMLVAVLTVWCFNWLNERLGMIDAEMGIAKLELGKYLDGKRREGKEGQAVIRG